MKRKKVILPSMDGEKAKNLVFKLIEYYGVKDSLEDLEKIFDENNQELYGMYPYNAEFILLNINLDEHLSKNLLFLLQRDIIDCYIHKIADLNKLDTEIESYNIDDYDPYTFCDEVLLCINPTELKEFIFNLKKKELLEMDYQSEIYHDAHIIN